jgi:sialate O-acetylesterase
VKAEWRACAPDKIQDFSAVLYFFGREIHREIDVPIGLIQSAWGGTRIEPWTPLAGFAKVPALADIHAAAADRAPGGARYKKDAAAYVDAMAQWVPAAREALLSGRGLPAAPQAPNWLPDGHQTPIAIYNAMIHPIVPFAIRGAIWYQGESNNGEGMAYFEKMKALIGGWREVWQEGDFPFYFVQIAPFDYGADRKFQLAELWEAQAAALSIPNTGMAVITDATDLKDIHPRDKQTVGKRLALLALAKNYGRDVVFSGPSYRDHSAEDGRIRVRFHHADGGLASRDGKPLTWFEVAGSDGDYAPAEAAIDDESVVVSSPAVHRPARVRFAWSQLAEPNLVNKAGLPAAAFRTHRPQ